MCRAVLWGGSGYVIIRDWAFLGLELQAVSEDSRMDLKLSWALRSPSGSKEGEQI